MRRAYVSLNWCNADYGASLCTVPCTSVGRIKQLNGPQASARPDPLKVGTAARSIRRKLVALSLYLAMQSWLRWTGIPSPRRERGAACSNAC
jgi:hypothetical protein